MPSEDLELDLSPEGAAVVTYACQPHQGKTSLAKSKQTQHEASTTRTLKQEVFED
ncbi:hypothetical protein LFREDSHE_26510 [Shewanella baltica]